MLQSKKKILIVYGVLQYQAINYLNELVKYFEVDAIHRFGFNYSEKSLWDGNIELDPLVKVLHEQPKLQHYSFIMGLDHGCIEILAAIKKQIPQIKVGCQILDYPQHIFGKCIKDFQESTVTFWSTISHLISLMDSIIVNKYNMFPIMEQLGVSSDSIFYHTFPAKPIFVDKKLRENFVFYSGRIQPDKGLHYIISALAILPNPPKLIVVGYGQSLKQYATFLKVPYEELHGCNEIEKFKLYHRCKCVVYGGDTDWITSLSVIEGLSVGTTAVVFDYPEFRKLYKEFVYYVKPRDIEDFAVKISDIFDMSDIYLEEAIQYYKEHASFESWVQVFRNMENRVGEKHGI